MRYALSFALLCLLAPASVFAQKARDLSKLDACKILPAADVSAATKRKMVKFRRWRGALRLPGRGAQLRRRHL